MKIPVSTIIVIILALLFFSFNNVNNGVAINETGATAHPSAILDVESSTRGALFPRMTSTERDNITNPADGLIIYNTSRKCLEFRTGNVWTSATPVGTIMPYTGEANEIPEGWFLCNGDEKSRTDYQDLFDLIQSDWGTAGTGMFKLPDLRGYFLRGADLNANVDTDPRTGGSSIDKIGSSQADATKIPNAGLANSQDGDHSHFTTSNITGTNTSPGPSFTTIGDDTSNVDFKYALKRTTTSPNDGQTNTSGNHTHTISGGDQETRPINKAVNYIIKY